MNPQPIGLYRPTTVRDATAAELDGTAYVVVNRLATTTDAQRVEICLPTGQWILADPADLVPGFYVDTNPDRAFIAQRYGDRWNGWDTPVVDRFTLQALLDATEEPHRWHGTSVWIGDNEAPLTPGPDGLYDLDSLCWPLLQLNLA